MPNKNPNSPPTASDTSATKEDKPITAQKAVMFFWLIQAYKLTININARPAIITPDKIIRLWSFLGSLLDPLVKFIFIGLFVLRIKI
jgi:hypothetical protein